jgi:hypothetical protein
MTNVFASTTPAEASPTQELIMPELQETAPLAATPEATPVATPAVALGEGQTLLAKISPAEWDQLAKLLSILEKTGVITISNSTINQSINKGTAVINIDVSELLGPDINLHIINPEKYIKLFKALRGNDDVQIIDNPEQQQYLIKNNDMVIILPKQIEELTEDQSPPDLSAATAIGVPLALDKNVIKIIKGVITGAGAEYVELLVDNDQLKAMSIPETIVYTFPAYRNEPTLSDVNVQLVLKSYSFLQIEAEAYEVHLGKVEDTFWLMSRINTGYISVTLYEDISQSGDENLLI